MLSKSATPNASPRFESQQEASVKGQLPGSVKVKTKAHEPLNIAHVVHNDTKSHHAIKYKEMLSESLYFLSRENFRGVGQPEKSIKINVSIGASSVTFLPVEDP